MNLFQLIMMRNRALPGMLRLSAYCAFLALVFAGLSAFALYAQAKDGAIALSEELAGLPGLSDDAEVLWVNGARLHHARAKTTESIAAVLDRVVANCDAEPSVLTRTLGELEAQRPADFQRYSREGKRWQPTVIREEKESFGFALCLAGNPGEEGRSLTEAIQQLAKTGDLSELGRIRMVRVQRIHDDVKQVVLFWTEGSLAIPKMFPSSGDAAGRDSFSVPRPPNARRTLSAFAEGRPYGFFVYQTGPGPEATAAFYDEWMKRRGWLRTAQVKENGSVAYSRDDGYQVFITTFERDGTHHVAVTEAGGQITMVGVRGQP